MEQSKKLLYITRYSVDEAFNLKKKFDGQLAAFSNLGFDVYYIGYDRNYLYLIHNNEKTVCGKTHFFVPSYLHTQFYRDLYKAADKAINEHGIDVVYWRSSPLFSSACKVAETAKTMGAKLMIEIPTFPSSKEDTMKGIRKAFVMYEKQYSNRFNDSVDCYVVIGEDAKGAYRGKPAINIENGIDVNSVPVRKPVYDKNAIHLLALASMSYWHGYDRLIKSLAEYKGDQNVIIHMVGGNDGGCLPEWKELTHRLNLDEKVIFHGQMSGEELDKMFDLCDIGINALAMFKKQFKVTMELKSREYIARGLPFVCTVFDPALNDSKEKWWIRLPNDSSIPDMEELIEFAIEMRNKPQHIEELRKFAERRLTWEDQYIKVFDTMKGFEK